MNKEYIYKHEAYLLLKNKAETYMLPATKEAYEKAAILIDSIKTHEVQPVKHGRWVCIEAEPEKVWCDNCKTTYRSSDLLNIGADDEKVNFCPNCGARMDGDVNE